MGVEDVLRDLARERGNAEIGELDPDRRLTAALAERLYHLAYCRIRERAGSRADPLAWREHLGRLTAACGDRGVWQSGWRVRERGDRTFTVEAHGVAFRAEEDQLRPESGSLEPGASCQVWVPRGMTGLSPGFYLVEGRTPPLTGPRASPPPWIVRLYWHLEPAGAVEWLGALTERLDRRRIPFQLKVASDRRHARRSDAGVLYIEPGHYRRARPLVREVHARTREHLRSSPPPLTRILAPGLGVAEGPSDGGSFGRHRCRLIARALVATFTSGRQDERQRRRAVGDEFRRAGLDPRRPHLAAGSGYRYRRFAPPLRPTRPTPRSATAARPFTPLEAATRIGEVLCAAASHRGDRCNWLGGAAVGRDRELDRPIPAIAALEADLYGGTAGVALFLAELSRRTGSRILRETALAALRQALDAVTREHQRYPAFGFHDGRLGIAWAARRAAAGLERPDLQEHAAALLPAPAGALASDPQLDLTRGAAGAIPVLLGLYAEEGSQEHLAAAVALGELLLRHAETAGKDQKTWPNALLSRAYEDDPPLTGLAHGVSGPGLALLELAAATGREEFRRAGRGAFAYEMGCFDSAERNWPDLRGSADRAAGGPGVKPPFMTAWCHGAPGIALARLRALEIDPGGASEHEPAARSGLETTLRAMARDRDDDSADTSLCHGLCGLVEIALHGARVLGEEAPRSAALTTVERLLERHGRTADWPSGEPFAAANPSLMLGLAGVGYTLLRIERHGQPPSVLLLEPTRGARSGAA